MYLLVLKKDGGNLIPQQETNLLQALQIANASSQMSRAWICSFYDGISFIIILYLCFLYVTYDTIFRK